MLEVIKSSFKQLDLLVVNFLYFCSIFWALICVFICMDPQHAGLNVHMFLLLCAILRAEYCGASRCRPFHTFVFAQWAAFG